MRASPHAGVSAFHRWAFDWDAHSSCICGTGSMHVAHNPTHAPQHRCQNWASLLAKRPRAMAAMPDGKIYIGFDNGKIYRCDPNKIFVNELWK